MNGEDMEFEASAAPDCFECGAPAEYQCKDDPESYICEVCHDRQKK